VIISVRYFALITLMCLAIVTVSVQGASGARQNDNKACGLVSPPEIESILDGKVAWNGSASLPGDTIHICAGQAANARITLLLVTGVASEGDRSDSKGKARLELVRQMGEQVEIKTFGPIVCSTLEPPSGQQHIGYSTTCTVSKGTTMAGIEVTANNKEAMLPIERLRPVAEKMMRQL